jgi:hypothetical protein
MKVHELCKGMLVVPEQGWEFQILCWDGHDKDGNSVNVNGMTVGYCHLRTARKGVMLYIGTTKSNIEWCGVYTHHHFLSNGSGVIMSGYDVRYLSVLEGSGE